MTDPTDPDFATQIMSRWIVISWVLGMIAGWFVRGVF